ncbi:fructose-bisphosphate aldolase [Plakobranchus ocellatus]|uniref:fructose-bisphosphate aldolase n=1 Tax=Plakobranchus ocellatus TaxID=259542 RepID=A0AAV4A0M4_9GAST|nr:fructose-bisphosphate aldolase [Plakobranchus ocellatus]
MNYFPTWGKAKEVKEQLLASAQAQARPGEDSTLSRSPKTNAQFSVTSKTGISTGRPSPRPSHTSSFKSSPRFSPKPQTPVKGKKLKGRLMKVIGIRRFAGSMAPLNSRPHVEYLPPGKEDQLRETAKQLMKPGLGILAADDSLRQIGDRLKTLQLDNTEANRRRYHDMLLGGDIYMGDYFSGVLIREESLASTRHLGDKLKEKSVIKDPNVSLGIRFDKTVERLVGTEREYFTPGLDKLQDACQRMRESGAKFGLWRCVYRISECTPTRRALTENSICLARFAVICQQSGLVPIVAPEVLSEGTHGYTEAQEVWREILTTLVKTLLDYHVYLAGTLVRVTPVSPGQCYKGAKDLCRGAASTMKILNECLPPALGGVLLARDENLSKSISILNSCQTCRIKKPFFVSFCFSLVIQEGVASMWAGLDKNLKKARAELMKRAKLCSLASMGQYNPPRGSVFLITREVIY